MKHNRVLVFSTDDHLYPAGGAEQAMGNITERLPHITFDLITAKLRRGVPAYEQVKNVHIHRMGFGVPKLDGVILALFGHICAYRLMKRHQYDLVWSIMASYGAFSAVRVKKKTGIPFLLTLQEGDSFEYIYDRVKYARKSFNEIFRCADGIQAISTYLLNWGKEMGYAGPYGRVVPNGVALHAFMREFDEDEILRTRTSFGFPTNSFILVTSSRLEQKNGISDVVSALPKMPPEVCFVICGSGSLESNIRAQVAKLGLEKRVSFQGFVDPQELPRIMRASDAFIRPSLSEGLGTAFLEAMAAGIPVLATLVGGIPDFLIDGETGFSVGVEDPQSIIDGVARIRALDPIMKQALLQRVQKMIEVTYDWNKVAHQMEHDLFIPLTSG